MKRDLKKLHVLTTTVFSLVIMIILFSNDNPVVLIGILAIITSILITGGGNKDIKGALVFFIPVALTTTLINMIFSSGGSVVLIEVFGRAVTLEALVYVVILSFKLMLVVLLFMSLKYMIDSDRAVTYFSGVMPKSTLMMMVGFKLIPNMRTRLKGLMEVYRMRGVSFEGRSIKEKAGKYTPLLSILMETSLEGAFDIGEAAYIRGFLSGRRTSYDKQLLSKRDWIIIGLLGGLLAAHTIFWVSGKLAFDVYSSISISTVINPWSIFIFAATVLLNTVIILLTKEN